MKRKNSSRQHFILEPSEEITNTLHLSRGIRVFIFVLFLIHSIIVDIDNGVISSSSIVIKRDLHMRNSEYGLFASIPFSGRIVGLILFMGLIEGNHRKLLIISTIWLHGLSFLMYYFISNKWLLLNVRLFTASMKVFSSIYLPIWIDQFGLRNYKTIMLTIAYMITPYGQIIGFTLGTIVFPVKWKYSLYLIGAILLIIGLFFVFIPVKYFSKRYMFIGYSEGEHLVLTKSTTTKDANSIYGQYDHYNQSNSAEKNNALPPSRLIELLSSGIFLFCSLTRSNLFFIFQVIHLFIKQYAVNGLKITDHKKILYFYSISSLLGPCLGSCLGGVISSKLGGYDSKRTIFIPIIFGIINCALIVPLATCSDFYYFTISLFGYFFSSSAILPAISGFLITSLPKDIKGFGTSFELLITTLLGKLPGPIIYGFIHDKYQSINSTIAWKICMYYYYPGFILLVLACICKRKYILEQEHDDSLIKKPFKSIKGEDYVSEFSLGDKRDLVKVHKPIPAYC